MLSRSISWFSSLICSCIFYCNFSLIIFSWNFSCEDCPYLLLCKTLFCSWRSLRETLSQVNPKRRLNHSNFLRNISLIRYWKKFLKIRFYNKMFLFSAGFRLPLSKPPLPSLLKLKKRKKKKKIKKRKEYWS